METETVKTTDLVAQAEKMLVLSVSSATEYTDAAYNLKMVKGFAKQLEDMRVADKEPHLVASREVDAHYKPMLVKLAGIEKSIKDALGTYNAEQERIQQAEQARLQEIARKERARLEQLAADAERKAQEKATQLRREAEAAAAAGRAEEAAKLAAKATATEDKAEAKADALAVQAANVVVPILATTQVKVAGISTTTIWKHRVVNPLLVPREYLMVNDTLLAKTVSANKGAITIPGVEIYSEQSIRAGAR